MLEKLLELLLHAKSGAIAGVLLIGTTGALVTATVENGVTTITLTQASASPSASASPTGSPTASPTATPTGTPTATPTGSPTGSPSSSPSSTECKAQVTAAVEATQRVDRAFSMYHTDLMHLRQNARTESAKTLLEKTDKTLKTLRENAVKAIHATVTCKKHDDDEDKDEDTDEHEDNDEHEATAAPKTDTDVLKAFLERLFGGRLVVTTTASPTPTATSTASATPTATPAPSASASPTPAPSGSPAATGDAKTLADQAIAAMKLAFDNAKAALPSPTASSRLRPSFSPEPREGKGDHHEGDRD